MLKPLIQIALEQLHLRLKTISHYTGTMGIVRQSVMYYNSYKL